MDDIQEFKPQIQGIQASRYSTSWSNASEEGNYNDKTTYDKQPNHCKNILEDNFQNYEVIVSL